jgi:hypothetical protein
LLKTNPRTSLAIFSVQNESPHTSTVTHTNTPVSKKSPYQQQWNTIDNLTPNLLVFWIDVWGWYYVDVWGVEVDFFHGFV